MMTLRSDAPRGIRNNNPGNIRKNESFTWQGEIDQDDKGFVVFDDEVNGLRALACAENIPQHAQLKHVDRYH